MGVWEALELLSEVVDASDPDTALPQLEHLFQTAEAIRAAHPDPAEDWFALTGLLHDVGKVLAHPKFGSNPQWAVVGDTYPVGCAFDPCIAHHALFATNPDAADPRYNTPCGALAAVPRPAASQPTAERQQHPHACWTLPRRHLLPRLRAAQRTWSAGSAPVAPRPAALLTS